MGLLLLQFPSPTLEMMLPTQEAELAPDLASNQALGSSSKAAGSDRVDKKQRARGNKNLEAKKRSGDFHDEGFNWGKWRRGQEKIGEN